MTEEEMLRNANAAQTLLRACADSYLDAARRGRLDAWARMAHSIVTLLERNKADLVAHDQAEPGDGSPS